MDFNALFRQLEPELIALRRELHRHPELSDKEDWTASRIQKELQALCIPFDIIPGTHNIVGVIHGAETGKAIALRADFDALPIQEETGAEYTSLNPGAMHACGHDAHTAMLLGAARILSGLKGSLKGTVYLCFQSGEEIGHGADEIISYLEAHGGVDEVIGLHIWGSLPEGTLLLIDGPTMAGGHGFDVTIKGQGGHGSRPDLARDPIKPACDLVLKISSIPTNFYDVLDPSVVHVGSIQAGVLGNIFPETALLKCGVRYFRVGGYDKIISHVKRMAEGVATAYDVEAEVIETGGTPPVVNHHEPTVRARNIVKDVEGLELNGTTDPICASDNFGRYLLKYPGFYGFLGGMNEEKGLVWPQHHCKFDIDESALRKGCEFMVRYALTFLK